MEVLPYEKSFMYMYYLIHSSKFLIHFVLLTLLSMHYSIGESKAEQLEGDNYASSSMLCLSVYSSLKSQCVDPHSISNQNTVHVVT